MSTEVYLDILASLLGMTAFLIIAWWGYRINREVDQLQEELNYLRSKITPPNPDDNY